jgi:hypothetical protein
MLDFRVDWEDKKMAVNKNEVGNCRDRIGSCRAHIPLDCCAAIGARGALNRVGTGTGEHRGFCWAFAGRQFPPQGTGSINLIRA